MLISSIRFEDAPVDVDVLVDDEVPEDMEATEAAKSAAI